MIVNVAFWGSRHESKYILRFYCQPMAKMMTRKEEVQKTLDKSRTYELGSQKYEASLDAISTPLTLPLDQYA